MPNNPEQTRKWAALQRHAEAMQGIHMRDLFTADAQRFEKFHTGMDGLVFDYSRHRITEETLGLLQDLAKASGVETWRERMFSGERINTTENRAVLHTALRGSVDPALAIDGRNIRAFVDETLARVKSISEKVRGDKSITDVVNIGIGGSDLGTRIVYETLEDFRSGPRVHFVSNIDGARISGVLKMLKPESTVFIVVSKTFSTMETLTNATTAKNWAKSAENFYAVTMSDAAAKAFGIAPDHILPMCDWIGGRMSLWSAAGLAVAIATGFGNFRKLLDGAKAMDDHFRTVPLEKNIPVLMALLGVWCRNFMNFHTHAILPYAHSLRKFPAFVQQVDMESNGKSIDRSGKKVNCDTGPVVFGETGTNAQHAFMQLLHQGTEIVPADFIVIKNAGHGLEDHHRKLNANALAQAQTLMQGIEKAEKPHKSFDGNRPSSMLVLDRLDPRHLGLLLALYEHKVFVQGIIWNINSFDQWGVELGKTLADDILGPSQGAGADQTTRALIQVLK